ncbi:MAG: S9 family peptidase [Gemmatimonadota bacterium]|jgi:dipeptidyl aminopeptidase/acylaminoacyl peptidase
MRRIALVLSVLFLSFSPLTAQDGTDSGRRAFQPQDWYKLTRLSTPAMSPDGRAVAFTVTTVDEARNALHSEIWMVPIDGGEPVRLTSPGTESSRPRWSDDGTQLFFTSRREGGQGSTWVLQMDGSRMGEAFQIDAGPQGSKPDDGSFTVWTEAGQNEGPGEGEGEEGETSERDDPYARMPPMARPPLGSVTRPVDPRRFDGMQIVDFPYKRNGSGFIPNRREPREWNASQIWRQASDDTVKIQLTDQVYSHRNAVVSPDGRWIAFSADPELRPDSVIQAERDSIARLPYDAARDEAPRNDSDIFLIPASGGELRRLTTMDGSERGILWSPDSRQIAFVSSLARTSSSRIWVVDAGGGEPRNVLGDWRYEPQGVDWMPNGLLAMSASVGGRTALFQVHPGNGEITEVISGRRRISGFSYDEDFREVAFVATSVDKPTELFVADIDGRNERRLTGFNDALNQEIAWPGAERFTYESVGGLEIEAWLQFPYGYEPGKRYPLVLYIHGGPHSAYGEGWFDEFHNLTGAGMFVLYTNPRGSSGYGADFTYSTRGRWGMEDYEDLMKAVDIVIQRDDVDPERLGVTGGSYGGFMTAWVTTKTDRFAAAQTDRMISNWFSWYGTSEAQSLTEFEFYGKPWDNPDLYWELSPIKYVANVTTPTLMVQSEEDHRTPMTDAEQWFMSLRKRGVPVEFMRYPRSTHDLSRTGEPWLLVDRLGRLRDWFTYWLLEK